MCAGTGAGGYDRGKTWATLDATQLLEEWQARALAAVDDLLNQKQLRERT